MIHVYQPNLRVSGYEKLKHNNRKWENLILMNESYLNANPSAVNYVVFEAFRGGKGEVSKSNAEHMQWPITAWL